MNIKLMLTRVTPVPCVVLWFALAVGIGQSNGVSQSAGLQSNKAGGARAIELNRQGGESIKAKQFEQAKALFKQAIQLDPRLSDAYENLALILLLDDDDAAAEQTATELLARTPGSYNGRLVAGIAALNRNKFLRAKIYLLPLITNATDDPLVISAYAIALDGSGDKAEAARFRLKAGKRPIQASDALLAGQIFRQPKLKEVAQEWLEAYVKDASTGANPDLLYTLAAVYAEQGRIADAAALYRRVLELSPDNVDTLVELSEVERTLGEQQNALSHLYAAKKLSSNNPATLVHFSQVCMRRRMYVDARDALKKVVAEDPNNLRAWYELGLAQFRLGETQDAVSDFKSALGVDGSDEWSRVGLGAALMSIGQQSEAETEFRRVLERNRHSAAAHYYLAQIDRNNNKPLLALSELKQAIVDATPDSRPLAELGRLQLSLHDIRSARTSLKKAIDLDPASATAHYYMAMVLRTAGETDGAKKEIELYKKCHEDETRKGIVGLVSESKWDYAGFLPVN